MSAENAEALLPHGDFIAAETLATSWAVGIAEDIEALVDTAAGSGSIFRSGARALGSDKSPIVVSFESKGASNV